MTTCPKCHYTRQPSDSSPDYECPKCGVIYAKAQPLPGKPLPDAWVKAKPEIAPTPAVSPISESALPNVAIPDAATQQDRIDQEMPQLAKTLLTDCPCCETPISFAATACPKCGHPNQDAANRAGATAGIIAVALGVSAVWAPYFAAPLLIPATLAAIAIAAYMRSHLLMLTLAAILVTLAGVQTYRTSAEIRKAAEEFKAQAKRSAHEIELFQERLRQEQARGQEELERTLRSLR